MTKFEKNYKFSCHILAYKVNKSLKVNRIYRKKIRLFLFYSIMKTWEKGDWNLNILNAFEVTKDTFSFNLSMTLDIKNWRFWL